MTQQYLTPICSLPPHRHYVTLSQLLESPFHKITVISFIGFIAFPIRCYPLNLVPQTSDIPNHVFSTNQSSLLLFHTRRSQYLTMKVLKRIFPFSAIASTFSNNSINPHSVKNSKQYGKCSFYFGLPTNLYNHPYNLFPFLKHSSNSNYLYNHSYDPQHKSLYPQINGPINRSMR